MPIYLEDYGKDVVTVDDNDVFFLDTNVVISYLYDKDAFHEATLLFIRYLHFKNIVLIVSEVVLVEVINSLARILYADDQISAVGGTAGSHRGRWSTHILKKDPLSLSRYNQLACQMLEPFLKQVAIVPADNDQIAEGLRMSYSTPLASADAFIVSSAYMMESKGIVSLDSDLSRANEVDVYTTTVKNDRFDPISLIIDLGPEFEEYLIHLMGVQQYRKKYAPTRAST